MHCRMLLAGMILLGGIVPRGLAGDWPMWRYDAGRSAVSPHALPGELHPQWVRQLPEARPAWPASQPKLQFDRFPQPIVMGQRLFVGSTVNDSIAAFDTRSGRELWKVFTEGPVRFAPVAGAGKVYAVSDDGHLYCLNAEDGRLIWKVNGGPAKRPIIGNDRLVSTWPARGGVVLADGVLYFAASIWPSMGIFIHAVDAETGETLWTNSKTGSKYTVHPHGAASFGSIVPQGYLAVSGDYLIVPGGRSLPAVFDRGTGELVHFDFGGKSSGGFQVMAGGGFYWVGGEFCQLKDGLSLARLNIDLMTEEDAISRDGEMLLIQSLAGKIETKASRDRKGKLQTTAKYSPQKKETIRLSRGLPDQIFCRAGDQIYFGEKGKIARITLPPNSNDQPLAADWSHEFEGTPATLLAADDRLFVVTEDSRLFCFAENRISPASITLKSNQLLPAADDLARRAKQYLDAGATQAGYAAVLGTGTDRLVEQLVRQSNLHVVAVDSDDERIHQLRTRLDQARLYGTRSAAFVGNPVSYPLPPYFADLIIAHEAGVVGELIKPEPLAHVLQALRPYGGVLVFPASEKQHEQVQGILKDNPKPFAGGILERRAGLTSLRREGPLPESAEWTHQYGDASNSVVSRDRLVKTPLGVLWFGGPSNDKVLPRHGHGPSPQVAGGRLVIEGPDMLRAVDVYTGRVHWEKDLPGVGEYYNVTSHFSGAGEVGSNYVTLRDRVYVIHGEKILELDAATGETSFEYKLAQANGAEQPRWGFLAVAGDRLVATSSPVKVPGSTGKAENQATIPIGYTAIVKPRAEWSYLAGSDPAENWAAPDFNSKKWKQGQAGFGYGDGDDRTVLKEMPGKFGRVYLRREIATADLEDLEQLALAINYDDAFIAYLNGKEVVRKNVGLGQGARAKLIISHEAKGFETFSIAGFQDHIRPGKNLLAIEGHNTSLSSSDFTLDPYLIGRKKGGSTFAKAPESKTVASSLRAADKSSSSRRLVVFDRKTRKELWSRDAVYSFRHNGIVVTPDRVYCIDSFSPAQLQQLKRRGIKAAGEPRLLALDAKTGQEIWSTTENIFGTFLNYSEEHDVLLQAGSAYRDRAEDEVGTGMVAYRGSTGDVLWQDLTLAYNGPCLLWRDKIITNGSKGFQLGLLDGQKTGWAFSRMYGCNTVLGSEHLLTFRSGAAGFCDLSGDSGTGNLGGFRSSCTSNLIAADGVLSAPDYTRTCSCAYQNQTSVAWIHMPGADAWTFSSLSGVADLKRIGWNLGAPGDRRSDSGTLWLEYPNQGGPTPKLDVTTEPAEAHWFDDHASLTQGENNWIAASGAEGLKSIRLAAPSALANEKTWTVRLYFSEPRPIRSGERAFSIHLQDKLVTAACDVVKEAGGSRRTLVKEYPNVPADRFLTIELEPDKASKQGPILSGVELFPGG